MKLHYSQTQDSSIWGGVVVSVPYEITLLSNLSTASHCCVKVSVPYEITLLSNGVLSDIIYISVSVPYEITLLSNLVV